MPIPDYTIVATLGPSTQDPGTWQGMFDAGAAAFRLNTSHLTLAKLEHWLDHYRDFLSAPSHNPPLVLDLQGSKWRLGLFPSFELIAGQKVELILAGETAQPGVLPVPHADFFAAADASPGEMVLNDAKIRLAVESTRAGSILARVLLGGMISPNKGITLPGSSYRKEALNEKDQAIRDRTCGLDWVRYAISYVRDAAEMARYRELFGPSANLIAKLERQTALDDLAELARHANELWLCRGDLGAELGLAAMAAAAHQFSLQAGQLAAPVLLAGQVLEHMTASPTPTRSEVCCLYDALLQGYSGVVLSDETAVGRYPVEAVQAAALFKAGS